MNPKIKLMYERLASFFVENLDFHEKCIILEAGCGSGQFTIPFSLRLQNIINQFKIISVGLFEGPYKASLKILSEKIEKEGLESFVTILETDVKSLTSIPDNSLDVIVSNDLFCELDREGLEKTLEEFHRTLKPNGQMAHGNLDPIPRNYAQQLLIEADSHSTDKLNSKYEWFSPSSEELVELLKNVGFKNVFIKYFETNVNLSYDEAINQLKEWTVNSTFIRDHSEDLKEHGLEFPIEYIAFCKKKANPSN